MSETPAAASILDAFRLDGKVAVVTGASSGLGVAIAEALAQAGADVALAGRRLDRLQRTQALVEATGRRGLTVVTDVADPASCQALIDTAVAELGRVDILVNNAGIGTAVPALRETPEQFRAVIDVNLGGSYWTAQAAARVMAPGSSIINIASGLANMTAGLPQAAYSASKAGVLALTRDLAQQWTGRRGIRVNAIIPGFFVTEMSDEYPEGYLDAQVPRILSGHIGEPREITGAIVLLAGAAGSYITGQAIVVDGGLSIT